MTHKHSVKGRIEVVIIVNAAAIIIIINYYYGKTASVGWRFTSPHTYSFQEIRIS